MEQLKSVSGNTAFMYSCGIVRGDKFMLRQLYLSMPLIYCTETAKHTVKLCIALLFLFSYAKCY